MLNVIRMVIMISVGLSVMGCVPSKPRLLFEDLSASPKEIPALEWTQDEAKVKISDRTFLRYVPGRDNIVYYFSKDGDVHSWSAGESILKKGTWSIQMRAARSTEQAKLYVCLLWPRYDNEGNAIKGAPNTDCLQPALLFIKSVDSKAGDVFGLMKATAIPFKLTIEKTTLDNLKSM